MEQLSSGGRPRVLRYAGGVIRLAAVTLVLWGAFPAWAGEPLLTLYVADGDDLDGWRSAAATTWPAGTLRVTVWAEALPEGYAPRPHASYEGPLPGGEIVLRTDDGERRMPVQLESGNADDARRAALLVLRHIAAPLGVADGGWTPTPEPEPAPEPASVPRGPPVRARFGMGVGFGFRSGLDTPCLVPSLRFEIAPGELPPHPVGILVEASGALLGSAKLGDVRVRMDGFAALAGVEIRPTADVAEFHLGVAGGARWLWALRTDGGGELTRATLPCVGGWIGVRRLAAAGFRFGVRIRAEAELGQKVIWLRAGNVEDEAELLPLVVSLQLLFDLGA